MADSDDLLRRLRAGDEAAFRQLVQRHQRAMVGVAMGFVRNREAAMEVVQETWLAAIDGGLDKFEGRSSLATWLYAVLANKARSRGVVDKRTQSLDFGGEDGYGAEATVNPDRFDASGTWRDGPALVDPITPERIVAGRQLWDHVREEIDQLPALQRSVVLLRDVEHMRASEVAEILDITASNQRVLLHRARARVRQFVEDLLSSDPAG